MLSNGNSQLVHRWLCKLSDIMHKVFLKSTQHRPWDAVFLSKRQRLITTKVSLTPTAEEQRDEVVFPMLPWPACARTSGSAVVAQALNLSGTSNNAPQGFIHNKRSLSTKHITLCLTLCWVLSMQYTVNKVLLCGWRWGKGSQDHGRACKQVIIMLFRKYLGQREVRNGGVHTARGSQRLLLAGDDLDWGLEGQCELDKWKWRKEALPGRGWRTQCLQGLKGVQRRETQMQRKCRERGSWMWRQKGFS